MIKNENEGVLDPFRVYVRIRPFIERELNLSENDNKQMTRSCVLTEDNQVRYIIKEGFSFRSR